MALSSDPHRTQIWNEFGSATQAIVSTASVQSLDAMHEHVFGAGVHERKDFANKGQPEVTALSVSVSGVNVDLTATIDTGGLSSNVQFQYWLNNTGDGDQIPPETGVTWVIIGDGGSESVSSGGTSASKSTSLSPGTYVFRARYWNAFISQGADREYFMKEQNYVLSYPAFATPSINFVGGNDLMSSTEFSVTWTWNTGTYGNLPSTFNARYRLNGGSWNSASLVSGTNFGNSNSTKTGTWDTGELLNLGDQIEVQVQAPAQGSYSASGWSNTKTFTFFI